MKGDGLQNGGALIVGPGGKLLLSFRQEGPAEHISNSKILQVFVAFFYSFLKYISVYCVSGSWN